MTTKAGVGFSQQVNSREAGIEATQAATAGLERCDLIMLFARTKHDPLLREGVRSIVVTRRHEEGDARDTLIVFHSNNEISQ